MRAPVDWLADYVDIDLPIDELAERLTMIGLKVEAIDRTGADWEDVVIGQVTELERHPTSKNPLSVARVSLGSDWITVVTGAPNVRRGDRVAVVRVGGRLPHGPDGGPMTITAKPMAGITSEGMLCSAYELGISDDHSGIYILPPDAPVGEQLRSVMGGYVLDIETNPNRPDTLSVIGIAREVAAMTEQQITPPDVHIAGNSVEWIDEESIPVAVEDPDLCPRYMALRIDGVPGDAATPTWLASRLEAAGMRPVNLLVDITNYVMLEYGQPMHAFDARRLRGGRIIVRRAGEDAPLRTLDGVERQLAPDMLVIADTEGPVAVAGVMGGEESEIAPGTTSVVLESATFDGASVRRAAQRLGLRTESSARFEKGLPPEQAEVGALRFVQLLAQITGASLRVRRPADAYPAPPEQRTVTMPMRDLHRLTGLSITAERASEALSLLEFGVAASDGTLRVEVPYWRRADIELSADLVEEVVRMVGYDRVPTTLPHRTLAPLPPERGLWLEGVVGNRLLAAGVTEAVTHSLTSPEAMARLWVEGAGIDPASQESWAEIVPNPAGVYEREAETLPVVLANPASRDRRVLRLSLVPSLLDVVARNLRHTDERLAFFEIARTFFRRPAGLPYERRTLAVVLTGRRRPRSWAEPSPGPYTFYDVKGLLETVLETLQVPGWQAEARPHPALHPGRSASLRLSGHDVAWLGELHPLVARRFEIEGWPVQVAEVDLDTLFEHASDGHVYEPLPRFPAAYRDIAVVVDVATPAASVLSVVRTAGRELLETARIFDIYTGAQLPGGKKSIAIEMAFRAPGATLTQEEVADIMARVVSALGKELQATIRE